MVIEQFVHKRHVSGTCVQLQVFIEWVRTGSVVSPWVKFSVIIWSVIENSTKAKELAV
jgi:hypothetical protein